MSARDAENEALVALAQRASEEADAMGALVTADEILRRDPAHADAMFIAGTAMLNSGQEGIAAVLFNAARCAADPDNKHQLSMIWCNIGCALQMYQPEAAYRAFRESLRFEPSDIAYDNLANVCSAIGRHAEALDWADKCESINPAHNRSFALMHLGRWEEAWREYAKGVGTSARPRTERNFDLPRWRGQKGKVIIHGEQGVGDEIMFMSMCPREFDGVIECNPRTAALFARSFPNAKVYGTLLESRLEWPLAERCDYHIEMGGLGEHFASEPFARGGFLAADPARCAAWGAWLGASAQGGAESDRQRRDLVSGGYGAMDDVFHHAETHRCYQHSSRARIGLAWTGGTWETGRARRSVPFDLIAKHLIEQHGDVTWVNLEYEDRTKELEPYPQVLNPYWATKKGAELDDLAALVSSLDLVITATQSVVDLCGALGVPVWVMTDENPQWRYSEMAGEQSMWFYESARLFRQKPDDGGDWARVVKNVTTALHKLKLPAEKPAHMNGAAHEPENDGWVSC